MACCESRRGAGGSSNAPQGEWKTAKPEAFGYSSARLEALRTWLKTEPTAAMMIVSHGQVIFSYGDVAHVSKIASVRKSVLSMLMGNYVESGRIDLNKTVKQLAAACGGPCATH